MTRRWIPRRVGMVLVVFVATALVRAWPLFASEDGVAGEIDFVRDIQPILRDHCYECHGRDARKGGLRLTNRVDAFLPGDLGIPVIEPQAAELSPLFELITSDDPEERMPKEKAPLPSEKIERIRRWIEAGAPWPAEADDPKSHWAYKAPVRPAVPPVRDASWPRNEIDRFVLARLEAEGLRPAREADPVTLLRRVHLDLTGLPPTPEEVDAYVADERPDRYERLVDRLLASPRFGEKWAREWLDAARYADSTGFQADQLNPNWPYRDWVIRALNEDQPYDEFTVEQLAGDLLPEPTIEQRIATGFNRSAPLNLEAGIHPEESRVAQVMDRVNTAGTIWLGSTLECAQCHDHKFDPFSQEEYYRLLAFFNNTPDESRVLGKVSFQPGGPNLAVPLPEPQQREQDALFGELRDFLESQGAFAPSEDFIRQKVQEAFENSVTNGSVVGAAHAASGLLRLSALDDLPSGAFEDWTERTQAAVERGEPQWEVLEPTSFNGSGGERARLQRNGSLLISGAVPDTSTYVIEVKTKLSGVTAFRLEAFRDEGLPGSGPGRGDEASPEFVVSEFEVTRELAKDAGEAEPVALYRALASHGHRGGRIEAAIDGALGTGWSIAERYGRDHWAVFLVDDPQATEGEYTLEFTIRQNAGFGKTIGCLRLSATNASADVVSLSKRQIAALKKPADERTRGDVKRLRKQYVATQLDGDLRRSLDVFLRKLPAYEKPRASVMEEMSKPRETHLLKRGNYLDPGEKVTAGTPAVFPPMADDLPRNRLGLARWIVDPANPLVGRVTVNRWWAELFGRGLVATPEDFGVQGERPTHPDLLDWLAVELVEKGWSRKQMLREMVTSTTYRQGSQPASKEMLERDPENVLLTRNPRLRLPAELIRDNALAVAGLLSPKMGGPAVYPPQPDGIWKLTGTFQPSYMVSQGEDRHRRGVYTIWRRSSPYPSFMNFDAKDRTACVLRRSRTNTPLQALTLLNDEAYVEAALGLAGRILKERPDADAAERARHGFRLAVGREPSRAELAKLEDLLVVQQGRIREREAMATALLASVPGYEPAEDVDREELAAWYFVASALLNLDETITRG